MTGLPAAIDQLAVAHLETRLLQKPRALAQIGAHRFRIAADRIDVRRCENFGRHLVAHRFEDFQFLPFRQARRCKLGALEVAVDALVLAIEQLLVHLLEIERVVECPAQPRILELIAAQIEHEALHPAGIVDREFLLDRRAFRSRPENHTGVAHCLAEFSRDPVGLVGLEGFQRHQVVAEILEAHFVEIVLADPDRQIARPNNP